MNEPHWLVRLIVSVVPFQLLLATMIWSARRIAKAFTSWEGRSIAQIANEYGRELKRSNDMLERFMSDYRQRLAGEESAVSWRVSAILRMRLCAAQFSSRRERRVPS
jgi:hypothetical protein